MAAGRQRLHGWFVVVAAVLEAAGGHADDVGLERCQHLVHIEKMRHAQALAGPGCALRILVAHTGQLGQRVCLIDIGMQIADVAEADDTNFLHGIG